MAVSVFTFLSQSYSVFPIYQTRDNTCICEKERIIIIFKNTVFRFKNVLPEYPKKTLSKLTSFLTITILFCKYYDIYPNNLTAWEAMHKNNLLFLRGEFHVEYLS